MRASIWLSVSRVRATRPSSRTNAAIPSTVRPNSGTTNPPRPSAAKITSSAAAALVSASCDVGVQVTCTPWNRQTCSATRVVVTGSATRPLRRSAATRSSTTSSARSSLTRAPFSSTRWIRSPTGSNRTPKAARDDDTTSASRCIPARFCATVWVGVTSSSRLFSVCTSTPIRPSSVGSTSDTVPPAQSATTLRPAPFTPSRSAQRSSSWV